ncbi:MAG: SRPBCC family protein [Acidimicrobiales bacterium]
MTTTPNPELDLVLEREIDADPKLVWEAWTDPEQVKAWFTPAPWTTIACSIDLRPGGLFHTTMASPEGDEYPNEGCFLEVVEGERLIFTSALTEGFRPVESDLPFTAIIDIEPLGDGRTRYRATACHADAAGKARHEEMGFVDGWGAALDQLVEHANSR